jgi:hypothetical protein
VYYSYGYNNDIENCRTHRTIDAFSVDLQSNKEIVRIYRMKPNIKQVNAIHWIIYSESEFIDSIFNDWLLFLMENYTHIEIVLHLNHLLINAFKMCQ